MNVAYQIDQQKRWLRVGLYFESNKATITGLDMYRLQIVGELEVASEILYHY